MECLTSVTLTQYPNFELILVDNGSIDGSAEFVKKNYGLKIKVLENKKNLGFSEGFNSGIRISRGKYIALLSNDMTVGPNWLEPIIELMETQPNVGLAGFKRLLYKKSNILDGIGGNLYLCGRVKIIGFLEIDKGQYDSYRDDIDYIGGAMVLRKKVIDEIGAFDPDYIIFSEDCDLCFKIRRQGYKTVYVPKAVIWHKGQGTLFSMDPKRLYLMYMSERSRIRFGIIHFVKKRFLAMLIIDLSWLLSTSGEGKKALIKAYVWNLRNIGITLKRRKVYGPSPPYGCKAPIIPFKFLR